MNAAVDAGTLSRSFSSSARGMFELRAVRTSTNTHLGLVHRRRCCRGFLIKDSSLVFGVAIPELNQQIRKQI